MNDAAGLARVGQRLTVAAPGWMTVEELVAAVESAVRELGRRLVAYRAAIASDSCDDRRVARR